MTSRMRSARIWIPAAVALAALALSGCSGTGKSDAKPDQEGPLDKYLSALWDGEQYTQERMDKEQREIEELVAECMTKEGFEYKPSSNSGGIVMMGGEDGEDSGPEWGSAEFAKEYGYGIVNWPGMSESTEEPGEEYVDPNQDYIESLSESEQQAYSETLYGPPMTDEQMAELEESDGAGFMPDWKDQGCYGAAQHEVQGEDGGMAVFSDPEFSELMESMNSLGNAIWNDDELSPEMQKLNDEWRECMADAGQDDYSSPMNAQNTLNEEFYSSSGDSMEEYKEPSQKEKDEFAKREIAVATADAECKAKVDYTETQTRFYFDAQQKFLDEHKSELDAMLSKYGAQKK